MKIKSSFRKRYKIFKKYQLTLQLDLLEVKIEKFKKKSEKYMAI